MHSNLYTSEIINRFNSLRFNDVRVINSPNHLTYRMGGCSTILRLDTFDNELRHCTSADLFGAVTSDCICEYLNIVNNKIDLLLYIDNAINNVLTNTNLDIVLKLPERLHSVNLILNYYKQHITKTY